MTERPSNYSSLVVRICSPSWFILHNLDYIRVQSSTENCLHQLDIPGVDIGRLLSGIGRGNKPSVVQQASKLLLHVHQELHIV